MMNTIAKHQYMDTLRKRYLSASKKEKKEILDEYCRNTGEERKYAIKKFRNKVRPKTERKPRAAYYDGPVKAALAEMWRMFDRPCGQRLVTTLRDETDRLRRLGELSCSDETAAKLKEITPATIDQKLAHEKEVEREKRAYRPTHTFPLKKEVPVKTPEELDREYPGVEQIDCVENCGASAQGEYVNSLSVTDICTGWWEGDAITGKGQERALEAIDAARERTPFPWREMHPDNGANIMNYHITAYAEREEISLSRSRAYKKNDNCFVEQKNSTHIRGHVGYLRYDTEEERVILSDLYRNELRLYKNFCMPVIKLVSKTKVGGKNKKRYDTPRTPYRRVMESGALDERAAAELRELYESLNPAALKREIDRKIRALVWANRRKRGAPVDARREEEDFGVIVNHLTETVSVS